MSNVQKTNFSISELLIGVLLFSIVFLSSCSNNVNQELTAIKALVPVDSTNQIAYIEKAIRLYNAVQVGSTSANRVGHPISQELSNVITGANNSNCLDSTKAVFFSFVNIFESIALINEEFDENSGIAVVFGKYPDKIEGAFKSELEAKGLDPTNYAGRSTVVLKYVKNLNPSLNNTTYYSQSSTTTNQIITDMGNPCPKHCPPGTFE